MIPKKQLLDGEDVRAKVEAVLSAELGLNAVGYKCDGALVINVLVAAALQGGTLESVCQDLALKVESNTLRAYLNKSLEVSGLREQEMALNRSLSACIPADLPVGKCEMALDYHDEPFYGKDAELRSYACGGQAKNGTTHFYRIASLYVMWRQVRLTVALTYVLPEDSSAAVVQRLVERMRHLNLQPSVLYMDKGFGHGAVIRYLQQQHIPALIACPIRGKQKGLRAHCHGSQAYQINYIFTDGTTVPVVLRPTRVPNKSGKLRTKWLACIRLGLPWSPAQCFQRYRRRFGIESSYRQLRKVRARTTSRNPALRFLLLGLALVLLNCWTALRLLATRNFEPGPLRWIPTQFQLPRFIAFLRRAIERAYGTIDHIPIYTF